MANKTEYSRLVLKRSTQTGVTPTIPTGSTINNDWLNTDLLIGEGFLNVFDDRLFYRTINGIVEIPMSGFSSANYYTESAFITGSTVFFNRTDTPLAYSVDLSSLTGITNIYNIDGTLTGNRTVDLGANTLTFTSNTGKPGVIINTPLADYRLRSEDLDFRKATSGDKVNWISMDGSNTILGILDTVTDEFIGMSVSNTAMYVGSDFTGATFTGVEYLNDYSANYSNRSLVDKEYVDTSKQYVNYWEFSGAAQTNIISSATWYKLNTSGTTSPFLNGDFVHTNNKVTYTGSTSIICQIEGIISVSSGNNDEIHAAFFKNGSLFPCSEQETVTSSGGKSSALPFHCVAQFNTNDYVEVYVKNETSTTNIDLTHVNVIVKEL